MRLVKLVVQTWALQALLWASDKDDVPTLLALHNLCLAMAGGEERGKPDQSLSIAPSTDDLNVVRRYLEDLRLYGTAEKPLPDRELQEVTRWLRLHG